MKDEPESDFRTIYARLRAERDRLWKSNRHAVAAAKRKNDGFVGGTAKSKEAALKKRAARLAAEAAAKEQVAAEKPAKKPKKLMPKIGARLPGSRRRWSKDADPAAAPTPAPAKPASGKRRGRPFGSKNRKREGAA